MRKQTVEEALSESVERYLRGQWSLEECVRRYPEYGEAIREYVQLTRDLAAMRPDGPSAAALTFGERLVLSELDRLAAKMRTPFGVGNLVAALGSGLMHARLATMAAAVAVALLVGSGVTLAATRSGPESPLYAYKLALEQVEVQLAPEERRAELFMDLAGRRLQELEGLARKDQQGEAQRIAAVYRDRVNDGLDALQELSTRETSAKRRVFAKSRTAYLSRLNTQRERLEEMAPAGSGEERAHLSLALGAAEAGLARAPTEPPAEQLAEAVTAAAARTPAPPVGSPGAVATAAPAAAQPATAPQPVVSPTPAAQQQTQAPAPTATPAPALQPVAGATATAVAKTPVATAAPTSPAAEMVRIDGIVTAMGQSALLVDGRRVVLDRQLAPDLKITGRVVVGAPVSVRGFMGSDGAVVAVEIVVRQGEEAATPQPTATPTPKAETKTPAAEGTPTPSGTPAAAGTQAPTPTPAARATPTPEATPEPTRAPPTPGAQFEIVGTVSAASETELIVDGNTIVLNAAPEGTTKVEGVVELGVEVRIKGVVLPGNLLAATEVRVLEGDEDSPEEEKAKTPTPTPGPDRTPTAARTGTVTAAPERPEDKFELRGVVEKVEEGAFVAAGVRILLRAGDGPRARVIGSLRPGAAVRVEGLKMPDGSLVATRIEVERTVRTSTPTRTPTASRTPTSSPTPTPVRTQTSS